MRTSVAALGSITILFVGVFAVSESAQQSKSTAMNASTSSSDAYNMSTEVFGGMMQAGGVSVVWFGVAAVVVGALGLLVVAGRGGGR